MSIISLLPIIGTLVDKAFPDKVKAQEIKAALQTSSLELDAEEIRTAGAALMGEIGGELWIQKAWRPVLMLTIVGVVANNYLLAPYLGAMFGVGLVLELPEKLWVLMTVGLGGYIPGRSLEKIAKTWKEEK